MIKGNAYENERWRAEVSHSTAGRTSAKTLVVITLLAALGGCEGSSMPGGDPGASALPAGESCGSIREKLNKLDRKGAQGSVEAQNAGKKLSVSQKQDADDYNRYLGQYLGSRCHV